MIEQYKPVLNLIAVYFGAFITLLSTMLGTVQAVIGICVGISTLIYTIFLIKKLWLDIELKQRELRKPGLSKYFQKHPV
jgi:hypothetical protein